ncbi:MAG: ABC transporter ATP-binding protein [Parcubacteria group bacterium]|jgi:putative ABC transport system ATP-binding protein
MENSIIKAEQLKVIYNQGKSNEVRSLDGVNLEIFPQEYLIVHGPSGCGKSTLMYSIAGLQIPTSGEISINGKPLSKMKMQDKLEVHQDVIGMIFQAFYLIESLSVIDNICLPMTFKGASLKERKGEAMRLLQRFGIAEQAHKFPNQLSGGQKQRVAIARSLINNPKIILADEPVGNLDSESSLNVMKIIKELNEVDKKTIILVTHNAEHLHYGDRIITMRDGKIINEEINTEKRPPEAAEKDMTDMAKNISPELRILMRAFKSLTPQQVGTLLIPYKSRQLLSHIISELTEEQLGKADRLLVEFLYKNIDEKSLADGLDKNESDGGANWDKRRARSFAQRAREIVKQADFVRNDPEKSPEILSEYIIDFFDLNFDPEMKKRFALILKDRIENKIDFIGMKKIIDLSRIMGGLGIYKNTSERIAREIEIIMLLGYLN